MKIKLYVNRVPQAGDTSVYRTFVIYKRLHDEVRVLEMVSIRSKLMRRCHPTLVGVTRCYLEWVDYEWAD
jgi:hypothetical protein